VRDRFDIEYTVYALDGSVIGHDTFGKPYVVDSQAESKDNTILISV
jgi:hypothetical protein